MHKIEDERRVYDRIYSEFEPGLSTCDVSCYVLDKARRCVTGVMRAFAISSLEGARVLDVGCGLGYFAEALREQGAQVTAIDTSSAAVQKVQELFPEIDARVASFPEDLLVDERFDLIWACDFSLLNTFDVDHICHGFVDPALRLLSRNGILVIGWHSDFSGIMGDTHWAHWPLDMIESLKQKGQLIGPRIVTVPAAISEAIILLGKILRKSVPIYFCRRIE